MQGEGEKAGSEESDRERPEPPDTKTVERKRGIESVPRLVTHL